MELTLQKRNALEYLTSGEIPVPHGFTTRLGGVSQGVFASLNLGIHRGDDPEKVKKNYEILGSALGFSPENLILTHQIHSDLVRPVTLADRGPLFSDWPDCDGLITATPGLALAIFTADCTPILMWDPVTGAVGAVHAGWRGTALDIGGKAVRAMAAAYGCEAKNLRCAIGPNIGPCCFETGPEVPEALRETYGPEAEKWIRPQREKYYVNLKAINALALTRAGVTHVAVSQECTKCQPSRYWSHRITGNARGSQGAVIVCKGGSQ